MDTKVIFILGLYFSIDREKQKYLQLYCSKKNSHANFSPRVQAYSDWFLYLTCCRFVYILQLSNER